MWAQWRLPRQPFTTQFVNACRSNLLRFTTSNLIKVAIPNNKNRALPTIHLTLQKYQSLLVLAELVT